MSDTQTNGTIGVAIVGCGAIGRLHAAVAASIPELRLSALVDAFPKSAQRLADELHSAGITPPRTYADLATALEDDAVDLVVLATPSGLHVEQASAAIKAGRHVVIEKPIDTDLPRARTIAELATEAASRGQIVSVISQHRFDTASQIVSDAIEEQAFGTVTTAIASTAQWRTQGYYDSADWRGTWAMDGGGAVMNQGVHLVDLLLAFMGRPIEVSGRTALLIHERIEVEDAAVATVTFESGALGLIHATTAAYPNLGTRVQIMGSLGSAIIQDEQLQYFHSAHSSPITSIPPMGLGPEGNELGRLEITEPSTPRLRLTDLVVEPTSHRRQYLDIVRAINLGTPPRVTATAALEALATIRAIYLSETLGRTIAIADVLSGEFDDVVVATGSMTPAT